jgi:translation initiation factor IF-3
MVHFFYKQFKNNKQIMIEHKTEENTNKEKKSYLVRLVTGDSSEILDVKDALKRAEDDGLDLIEIAPNAKPPVYKIMDYNKFAYEKKKKEKENLKSNKKTKVKEIRFTYNTGDHDFNFKLKHAIKFLENGDKVKANIFFSGREINFKDIGQLLLLRFVDELKDYGKVETLPKLEGNKMSVQISPKK